MLVVDGTTSSACLSFRGPLAEKDADSHARDEIRSSLVLLLLSALTELFNQTASSISLQSLLSSGLSFRAEDSHCSVSLSSAVWNTRLITAAVYSSSCQSANLPCTLPTEVGPSSPHLSSDGGGLVLSAHLPTRFRRLSASPLPAETPAFATDVLLASTLDGGRPLPGGAGSVGDNGGGGGGSENSRQMEHRTSARAASHPTTHGWGIGVCAARVDGCRSNT